MQKINSLHAWRIPQIAHEHADCLGSLLPRLDNTCCSEEDIWLALNHPLWKTEHKRPFSALVRPNENICIVISDHTRKTATDKVLPVLLQQWLQQGCRPENFLFLVASGIHRHPKSDELQKIIGSKSYAQFRDQIICHDPDDQASLVSVGRTSRGHEVFLNQRAVAADRLILIGAATFHYHAGFGGGRKSLVPGLAGRNTIAHNHSLALDPVKNQFGAGVEIGRLTGNPVAEEMLEGALLCEPDGIINTVLSPAGDLVGVYAGDLELAHLAACQHVEKICRINVNRMADFVIASAGAASNWIQSHKALFNASRCIRPGGRIILWAPCPEGLGDERFRHWISRPNEAEIYAGLRENAEVLAQTALSTRQRGIHTVLVTGLNQQDRHDLGITCADSLESALNLVLTDLKNNGHARPNFYVIPNALTTVPFPADSPCL